MENRSNSISIQSEMKAESALSLKILFISNYCKILAVCPVSVQKQGTRLSIASTANITNFFAAKIQTMRNYTQST